MSGQDLCAATFRMPPKAGHPTRRTTAPAAPRSPAALPARRPPAAAAAARPPPADQARPGVARRFLGALARPFDGEDIGTGLAMMNTQAEIQLAADNPALTYAATQDAAARTRAASYGWYGYGGRWRRH